MTFAESVEAMLAELDAELLAEIRRMEILRERTEALDEGKLFPAVDDVAVKACLHVGDLADSLCSLHAALRRTSQLIGQTSLASLALSDALADRSGLQSDITLSMKATRTMHTAPSSGLTPIAFANSSSVMLSIYTNAPNRQVPK